MKRKSNYFNYKYKTTVKNVYKVELRLSVRHWTKALTNNQLDGSKYSAVFMCLEIV